MLRHIAQALGLDSTKKNSLPLRLPLPPESLRFEEAERRMRSIRASGASFTQSRQGEKQPEAEGPRGFSLQEVQAAIATDSYLRQAVGKYVDLIFKEDWSLNSSNKKALDYLKLRLDLMAAQTGIPTRQFMRDLGDSLVKYHNVFISKVRSPHALAPPGVRLRGIDGKHPIGGYFLLPPATMRIARRWNGEVVSYEQRVPGHEPVRFRPDEIIHMAYTKEIGHAFGVPFLTQVIDDVRMLREVEYNVSRLLYLYLHPIYVMSIGKDEPGKEPTPEEMQFIKNETRDMELGGILYLPADRYKLDVKGAQGEALNAEWALQYFERRVLAGMGTPETAFGRGDAVNRATADQLTAEMHDRAQAYQQAISMYVEEFIFRELLMEAGFDPLLKPEDRVKLTFQTLRTDEIIKQENHAIYKYEHNITTFEETRQAISLEPLLPEEEKGLHFWRVTIPRIQAEAAARQSTQEPTVGNPETDNKNKPRNQHGTKASPGSATRVTQAAFYESMAEELEDRLRTVFERARNDLAQGNEKETSWVLEAVRRLTRRLVFEPMFEAVISGLKSARDDVGALRQPTVRITQIVGELEARANAQIEQILDEWALGLPDADEAKLGELVRRSERRILDMARYYIKKGHWYAYAKGAQALGRTVGIQGSEQACKTCSAQEGNRLPMEGDVFSLVPPFHPHCRCRLKLEADVS